MQPDERTAEQLNANRLPVNIGAAKCDEPRSTNVRRRVEGARPWAKDESAKRHLDMSTTLDDRSTKRCMDSGGRLSDVNTAELSGTRGSH